MAKQNEEQQQQQEAGRRESQRAEKEQQAQAKAGTELNEAQDPTVRSGASGNFPDGVNPAPPVEEADHAAVDKVYEDMPDDQKPNVSSVAQVEIRPEEQDNR